MVDPRDVYRYARYRVEKKDEIAMLNKLVHLSYKFGIPVPMIVNSRNGIITTKEGVNFYVNLIEPLIYFETFAQYIHAALKTQRGSTIIDAGACFGDSALYYAHNGLKVYAIEPDPYNFRAMERNISINPKLKSMIRTYHAALGVDGKRKFSVRGNSISSNGSTFIITQDTKKLVYVRSYSLGSFLKRCGLKSADYLKMDCKGAEMHLSVDDLKKVRKGLKIEYTFSSSEHLPRLISTIREAGFKIKEIVQTNKLTDNERWRWGTIIAYRQN